LSFSSTTTPSGSIRQKSPSTSSNRLGHNKRVSYDKLVIGTGAEPVKPAIAGVDNDGVLVLHTMEDSFRVHDQVVDRGARRALIIGGGYIGLEMADALRHRGLQVTLVEQAAAVMTTVDGSLGHVLGEELERHGIELVTGIAVKRIERAGDTLRVFGLSDFERETDIVLVVVGVVPNTRLAMEAGIITGIKGAIRVNRQMETNLPDIFAAGDCVETWHRLLERPAYLPLGTTAHKQGRIAGENAAGGNAEFQGSLGTQVVKVFDLAVARTGLRDAEAIQDGRLSPVTLETRAWDHKAYYPGAHELIIRVTGDARTGQLLGAQIVGHKSAEVAKRIDIFATALFHRMAVKGISELDLSYTPPFSAPWDPVQVAADAWVLATPLAS
jgi:NADPH-dependent 2,4-dienoyl-CoA reductase/sulfur reductase-like enzyme